MTLIDQVNRLVFSAAKTPEEAIRFFLKLLIEGAENVASYRPMRKEAKVYPMKDSVVNHRQEGAALFIDRYNNFISEMSLHWADLAKKWNSPKSTYVSKVLIKEISTFREKLTHSFDEMKKASLAHIDNITFVLDSYSNLSRTQRNLLEKTIKHLTQISKMTYENFITKLKKGELTTLG